VIEPIMKRKTRKRKKRGGNTFPIVCNEVEKKGRRRGGAACVQKKREEKKKTFVQGLNEGEKKKEEKKNHRSLTSRPITRRGKSEKARREKKGEGRFLPHATGEKRGKEEEKFRDRISLGGEKRGGEKGRGRSVLREKEGEDVWFTHQSLLQKEKKKRKRKGRTGYHVRFNAITYFEGGGEKKEKNGFQGKRGEGKRGT